LSENTTSENTTAEHTHAPSRSRLRALGTRWLGIGLATFVSIVTLGLGFTGRLTLYISPESVWFACAAAVVTLLGAIWSCTLPLGSEGDHGHDHGHGADHDDAGHDAPSTRRRTLALAGIVGVVVLAAFMIGIGVNVLV